MGFSFEKHESMQKAIRRLGRQRIEHALNAMKECARTEGIHSARKDIKKARALLRLAREHLSRKRFRAINKGLQKAAACLAKPRDAAIKVAALRDLTRRFKAELPAGAFRRFRIELRRDYDKAMRKFAEKETAKLACGHLSATERDFKELKFDADGWEAIAPGLKRTYRQCREAHERAVSKFAAQRFHDWRKRSKTLWHQLVLLKPIWPEKLDRMTCELEAVGDLLGEDHDLFVLEQAILDSRSDDNERRQSELKLLRQVIHQRQAELRQKALAMSKYFFEEKPSQFCARLGGYWGSWVRGVDSRQAHARRKGARQ